MVGEGVYTISGSKTSLSCLLFLLVRLLYDLNLLEVVQPPGEQAVVRGVVVVGQERQDKHEHQQGKAQDKPPAAGRGRGGGVSFGI